MVKTEGEALRRPPVSEPNSMLHRRGTVAFAIGLAACAGAGCNRTSAAPPAPPPGTVPGVTPSTFALPVGTGCGAEIARFRAVLKNDLDTGHVGEGVYKRANTDLDRGDAACSGGREGEGRAILASTKSRFGYP